MVSRVREHVSCWQDDPGEEGRCFSKVFTYPISQGSSAANDRNPSQSSLSEKGTFCLLHGVFSSCTISLCHFLYVSVGGTMSWLAHAHSSLLPWTTQKGNLKLHFPDSPVAQVARSARFFLDDVQGDNEVATAREEIGSLSTLEAKALGSSQ